MSSSKKVSTAGGNSLEQSPFGVLQRLRDELPAGPSAPVSADASGGPVVEPKKHRGRVDIRRATAGRGGKTVTVVEGFVGIGLPEKESLVKMMQKICGCGGTIKEGRIEIQGDKRKEVARVLEAAGFRPVFAGG